MDGVLTSEICSSPVWEADFNAMSILGFGNICQFELYKKSIYSFSIYY